MASLLGFMGQVQFGVIDGGDEPKIGIDDGVEILSIKVGLGIDGVERVIGTKKELRKRKNIVEEGNL
ncbi:unnamed protein product, partial [Ilex paraguariensis]